MEKEYLVETTSREDAEHVALDQAFCESISASDLDVDIYVDEIELA